MKIIYKNRPYLPDHILNAVKNGEFQIVINGVDIHIANIENITLDVSKKCYTIIYNDTNIVIARQTCNIIDFRSNSKIIDRLDLSADKSTIYTELNSSGKHTIILSRDIDK